MPVRGAARARGEVVRVAEAGAPVAEVGAEDEDVGRVGEVRGQQGAVGALGGGVGGAHEDGDEGREGSATTTGGEALCEEVMDVREVHFETVFGFVDGERHAREVRGGVQGGDCGSVEGEGSHGGGVGGALREGAAGEVEVVGGTEEEDSFSWRFGEFFFFEIGFFSWEKGGGGGGFTLWRGRGMRMPMRR